MADQKLTDRTELAAAPADGDLVHVVDVSDTTDNASGTSKKITITNLIKTYVEALTSYFNVSSDTLDDIPDGTTYKLVTAAEKTVLGNTSGTNTGDMSDAAVKTAYENNADTNAYDDAAVSKLSGIEASADVTDATNVAAAGALMTDGSAEMSGDVAFAEAADHSSTPSAGKGYLWVKNTAPSSIIFTDDTGADTTLGAAGGGISNVVEDTTPQLGGALDVNGQEITGAIDLHSTGDIIQELGDAAGANKVIVKDSGAVEVAAIDSDGNITTSGTVDGRDLATDGSKLDGVEASADVTDATNVTAAGALMDSELTDIAAIKAASDASIADTDTGTSTSAFVTPDSLAGSVHGVRTVQVTCFDYTTDTATGDGKGYFHIPASMNGMNLTAVHAEVITAGTTGTTDIQVANVTQAADMLTTKITIDSTETGSDTAVTPAVIDTANDDVATNDLIRIDVDAVSTTAAKGLIVTCEFQLP